MPHYHTAWYLFNTLYCLIFRCAARTYITTVQCIRKKALHYYWRDRSSYKLYHNSCIIRGLLCVDRPLGFRKKINDNAETNSTWKWSRFVSAQTAVCACCASQLQFSLRKKIRVFRVHSSRLLTCWTLRAEDTLVKSSRSESYNGERMST